ncbi:MAG: hypothetical protein ACFFB7_01615 [Candidatus Sifarchaeia archaeon]
MSNSADYALGCLGVDLDRADTTAQHDPGLTVMTKAGEATYARAAAATPFGSLVGLAPSSATATVSVIATLTSTGNVQNAQTFGVANASVAQSSWGWFQTRVTNPRYDIQVRAAAACQPNAKLFTTATGGVVDDATVSTGFLQGLTVLESAASASTVPCVFHSITNGKVNYQ